MSDETETALQWARTQNFQSVSARYAKLIVQRHDDLAARLAEADEKLRRIRRMSEVTAAMMRDPERTGGWSGSERVARQFDRLAALAATTDSAPAATEFDEPHDLRNVDWTGEPIQYEDSASGSRNEDS
jgi:hypothetical protein